MTATQDILDSIENRLRELNEQISALNAARAALNAARAALDGRRSGATTTQKKARTTPRPDKRRRRAKADRAVEVVPAGKVELLLSESAGLTTSALAQRANADHDQVLTLLRELETGGRVRRTGQRRATRWHVITDEERIQERAAELSARSRRPANVASR
jgi:hypothetical protein